MESFYGQRLALTLDVKHTEGAVSHCSGNTQAKTVQDSTEICYTEWSHDSLHYSGAMTHCISRKMTYYIIVES